MSQSLLADDLNYIVNHTRSFWESAKDRSFFVTGGTGFIGTWLLETMAWANRELSLNLSIVVLTRDAHAFAKKAPHLAHDNAFSFVIGDVRDFTFPLQQFSYVIHAATDASAKLNAANPQLMLDTIIEGTRHTLDFAAYTQAEKTLFLSSGAVYGRQPPELSHIAESFAGYPDFFNVNSAYAVGKRVAEHMCLLHAAEHKMHVNIARCFAFVGPYLPLDIHFAIGNFILDGLLDQDIVVKSDGSPYRSYLYAADLVIWQN